MTTRKLKFWKTTTALSRRRRNAAGIKKLEDLKLAAESRQAAGASKEGALA